MKTMQYFLATLFVLLTTQINAQYYYKDVLINKETNSLNEKIRKAKITKLVVKSYHFDGEEVDDFLCEQEIENNGKHVVTITGSPFTGENHLHSFFTVQGQLLRSVDSNPTLVIQNNYEYSANNLSKISITSFEPENKALRTTEIHQWFYDTKGVAEKLFLIKNNNDTTTVVFKKDSITQLVTDEIIKKKGKEVERYYYYYDAQKRLTDVVRFHPYKRKLLPELIFDYNDKNEVIKKTFFVSGTNDYTFWYYFYDKNGLKSEEQCFLKGNMLKGKLKYNYAYE
jgi:hypothetical protein